MRGPTIPFLTFLLIIMDLCENPESLFLVSAKFMDGLLGLCSFLFHWNLIMFFFFPSNNRHTASIAAGNHNVPVIVAGHHFGNSSGMAPRAQ